MTTVLGINSFFEHPAVALIRNDEVLFAIEDERFTGVKHGKKYTPYRTYLPVDSLYHALADTGTTLADIDEIAYSYDRRVHLRSLWGCFTKRRFDSLREELSAYASAAHIRPALRAGWEIPQKYRGVLDPAALGKIRYQEWRHHLSHAASAFFCSGYGRALVVVADGAGEHAGTSVYLGTGRDLHRIGGAELPHSLGIFYSMVTKHLGFEPFGDEFKVMGLAAYGERRYRAECDRLIRLVDGGGYRVDAALLRDLPAVLGPARRPAEPLTQQHMDLANSAQLCLEEALEHVVRHHMRRTGMDRLCLAGGTFLNCVANGRLARLDEVRDIFVQPAAHDAGTALGAAVLSSIRRGGPHQLQFGTAALGTEHDDAAIARVLATAGLPSTLCSDADLIDRVATRLAGGAIGGVFRGRMEFGPRALGMRSLLADPRSPGMRDRLNRIKGREGFRPVAPIVTAEAFDRYFDGERNRYMLFTTQVRPEVRDEIPSVVHNDGTARVQSVEEADDPWLHQLLGRFGELTGVPMLINTSLNVRGRPIVETPEDALACLYTTSLDFLVLGNRLIERTAVDSEQAPAVVLGGGR